MRWPAPALLLLCAGLLLVAGCTAPLKEPTVTMTDITLTGISLSSISVNTTVRVDNPNPLGITIASLSFDLYYETGDGPQYIGHGGRENLTIGANNAGTFDIPAEIGTARALQAAIVLFRENSLTLVARGTAAVDLKVLTVRIPFEKRKVVPQGNTEENREIPLHE